MRSGDVEVVQDSGDVRDASLYVVCIGLVGPVARTMARASIRIRRY
jgi:hypothetical protein